jgi:hypothetical protein
MKTFFFTLSLFLSLSSFGQQFLWTTNENGLFPKSEMKVISKEDVLEKLKTYFENYDGYYDGTGFTKEGFFKKFESSNSYKVSNKTNWEEFKKSVSNIKDLTITCIKSNEGNGSNVMILIINKNNFDTIIFSNSIEDGFISTGGYMTFFPKFEKFYNSLIDK